MPDFKPITTIDECLGQEGRRLAFCPTGVATWDQTGVHGIEEYVIHSCEVQPSGDRITLTYEGDVLHHSTYPCGFRWPIPVMLEVDPPATMTTYKRADGEAVYGEYEWVADLEFFEDEAGYQEGVRVIKEVWVRSEVEEIHLHPEECFMCERPWHGEHCDQEPED